MRVYKYWAMGQLVTDDGYELSLWRGSNINLQDAQRIADAAVAEMARQPRSHLRTRSPDQDYTYHTRHVPEELVSSFPAEDGSIMAAVTRNRYGALVLNTADLVIIDADVKFSFWQRPKPAGMFDWLLGKRYVSPPETKQERREREFAERQQRIMKTANEFSQHAFRIYRTRAGFRIILVDQRMKPNDPEAIELLKAFDSDQNYRNLCQVQQSFRARLTPKPFNLEMDYPPHQFPYTQQQQNDADAWERQYESSALKHRVCQLVGETGRQAVHPDIQFLIDLHDEACRIHTNLPLA